MNTVSLMFNFKMRIKVIRCYFYHKNHLPNNVEIPTWVAEMQCGLYNKLLVH